MRAVPMNETKMFALIEELYPICRSTGNGLRQTRRIQQEIPLHIEEVASGTRVLDWTVPREWNIRDAYIQGRHPSEAGGGFRGVQSASS